MEPRSLSQRKTNLAPGSIAGMPLLLHPLWEERPWVGARIGLTLHPWRQGGGPTTQRWQDLMLSIKRPAAPHQPWQFPTHQFNMDSAGVDSAGVAASLLQPDMLFYQKSFPEAQTAGQQGWGQLGRRSSPRSPPLTFWCHSRSGHSSPWPA